MDAETTTQAERPVADPALVGECPRCQSLGRAAIALRYRLTRLEERFGVRHHEPRDGDCAYCHDLAATVKTLRHRLALQEQRWVAANKKHSEALRAALEKSAQQDRRINACQKKLSAALAEIARLEGER